MAGPKGDIGPKLVINTVWDFPRSVLLQSKQEKLVQWLTISCYAYLTLLVFL